MASMLRIIDLDGKTINVIKGAHQTWSDVVERARLPKRFEFCLRHWMSDDPIDTETEERIKAYLDRVGYILIQDKPDSKIVTDYKALRDKIALVPVSGIPQLENMLYSQSDEEIKVVPIRNTSEKMTKAETKVYNALTKPRRIPPAITKLQEKRKRIDELHEHFPGVKVTFARVDTDNVFEYANKKWVIVGLKQYEPKDVHGDLLYDMDHVVCAEYLDNVWFYDEDFIDITNYVRADGGIGIRPGL